MLGSQGVETVEHNELDIVVALLDDKLDERASSRFDSSSVLRECGERGGSLVLDRVAGSREELRYSTNVASTVGRVAATVFADELDDGELHELVLRCGLVTEAVAHGTPPVTLRVECEGAAGVTISVSDSDPVIITTPTSESPCATS